MYTAKQSLLGYITQDWKANTGNSKGRFVLVAYRLAAWFTGQRGMLRLLGIPYCALYRIGVAWIMGIELPLRARVGPGLRLYHGQGLVVHECVEIGAGVSLRHCTTIGVKVENGQVPKIGDGVDIGSNAVILGAITLGDGCVIGAGCVVTKSVAPNAVMVGNPARALHPLQPDSGQGTNT